MRELATNFLTGLAQAVSTMTLYKEGHPARERAIDNAHEQVLRLQEVSPTPVFTFLGRDIVLDGLPVRGLKRWDWGQRLASVGIQRLEFVGPVTRDDLEVFLEDAFSRLAGEGVDTAVVRQTRPTQIRYGSVGIGEQEDDEDHDLETATLNFTLREELDAVEWIHDELKGGSGLQLLEAETVVRSLSVAMHGDQEFLIPMLKLKRFDQYTTTHAMNVSVLAMALAEFIGLGPREIRSFGISGLLHDLGKVIVPEEILNKPGKLTDDELEVMRQHTVEGARIIIETEEQLDLAAVVAYEHHIMLNGGGYPSLKYPRPCHQASNIVHVCDVFDALRTDRPYRDAMSTSRSISIIEGGAGTEFVLDLAQAFIRMIRQWEGRIAYLKEEDEALPIGQTDGSESPSENGGGGPASDEYRSLIDEITDTATEAD